MESFKYLNTYEQVSELVTEAQERTMFCRDISLHYRGQGRPEYKLIPQISRNLSNAKDVQAKEEYLISFLKTKLVKEKIGNVLFTDPYLTDNQNIWNILFQSQHIGMQTRLLDWSMKWEVALWFTVENPKNDNVDGQFWLFYAPDNIHPSDSRDNFYKKDLNNLDKTYLINPSICWSDELKQQVGEIKRQRQFGKFSISPYELTVIPLENQPEISPYLEKYCIPAKIKGQIRLDLASKGIHRDWLYYRDANTEILKKLDKIIKKQGIVKGNKF